MGHTLPMYLSYLATILVLFGVYYISRPRLRGQYILVAADLTWLLYSVLTHQWALTLQSIVLIKFAVEGIRNWRREGIKL